MSEHVHENTKHHDILNLSKIRWLNPTEVEYILYGNRWEVMGFQLSCERPRNPTDGQIFFFDRSAITKYKNDGVQYSLKKNKDRIQETYHNFKINGVERISGVYCRGMNNKNFCRRIYRLMGEGESNIVLVHYREEIVMDEASSLPRTHNQHLKSASSSDHNMTSSDHNDYADIFNDDHMSYEYDLTVNPFATSPIQRHHDNNLSEHHDAMEFQPLCSFDSPLHHSAHDDDAHSIIPSHITIDHLQIVDFIPSQGSCAGGEKFILILNDCLSPSLSSTTLKIAFGHLQADAEIIAPCALRTTIPSCSISGSCSVQVWHKDKALTPSALACFEYTNDIIALPSILSPPSSSSSMIFTTPATDTISPTNTSTQLPSTSTSASNPIQGSSQPVHISSTSTTSSLASASSAIVSDPSPFTWLSDAELGNIPPTELSQVMNKSVTAVMTQLVNYAAHDDDLQAELDTLDSSGYSLLHYCCLYDLSSLLPVLIDKHVQINQKSSSGKTALHLAVEHGSVALVANLLMVGADYHVVDKHGLTPRDIGIANKHKPDMVEYCMRYLPVDSSINSSNMRLQSVAGGDTIDDDFMAMDVHETAPSPSIVSETSTKLLYEAFASFSLADKCALSLSFHNNYHNHSHDHDDPNFLRSHDHGNELGHNHSHGPGQSEMSPNSNSTRLSSYIYQNNDTPSSIDTDIQSVLSESDKESLDVAMSMMGEEERIQVENEVLIIQSNVRAWLLRKNYVNLRDSARILQGFWRDNYKKRQTHSTTNTATNSNNITSKPRKRTFSASTMVKSIQQQKRDDISSNAREFQAAAMLQAATRGMIARKSFVQLRRQAMASLILQKSFLLNDATISRQPPSSTEKSKEGI